MIDEGNGNDRLICSVEPLILDAGICNSRAFG